MAGSAFSAGSFIALACEKVYMAPATVIGAAEPVLQTPEGVKPAGSKAVSGLKKKVAAVANENGHPENLVIAMVDPDYEVFRVRVRGRQEFLTEEQIRERGQADPVLAADMEESRFLVTKKGEPLTLTVREAVEYGLAREAADRPSLLRAEGAAGLPLEEESFTWSETLVSILTSTAVASMLMLVGLILIYLELKTPGFGLPGVLGILCVGLVLFGHYLAGLAEVTEIVLILFGFGLIAAEILFVPGIMVLAILGLVFVLAGLIMALVPFSVPDFGDTFEVTAILNSTARMLLTFVASFGAFFLLVRFLRKIPVLHRLVLQTELAGGAGSVGVTAGHSWVGKTGVTLTPLLPGGKAEIDGDVVDVVADGESIEKGEAVRVIAVDGTKVLVGRVKKWTTSG
jgi:membrane-bound serine protease (ClpP class)